MVRSDRSTRSEKLSYRSTGRATACSMLDRTRPVCWPCAATVTGASASAATAAIDFHFGFIGVISFGEPRGLDVRSWTIKIVPESDRRNRVLHHSAPAED